MPDLFFQPSLDFLLGEGSSCFPQDRGKMGKTGLHLFYYAIASLHQQEFVRERGFSPKGFPAMCVCAQLTCWCRAWLLSPEVSSIKKEQNLLGRRRAGNILFSSVGPSGWGGYFFFHPGRKERVFSGYPHIGLPLVRACPSGRGGHLLS